MQFRSNLFSFSISVKIAIVLLLHLLELHFLQVLFQLSLSAVLLLKLLFCLKDFVLDLILSAEYVELHRASTRFLQQVRWNVG